MTEIYPHISWDGGPLIVLQESAVSKWQGAKDFEDSLMNGGELETDYDVLCERVGSEFLCVMTRHDREMLGLWDSEEAGCVLPPELFSLPSDVIVLSQGWGTDDEFPGLLLAMQERVRSGNPDRSLPFNVQDASLRFQPAVDYVDPEDEYKCVDIPVVPGLKRCDLYMVEILVEIIRLEIVEPIHYAVVVISPISRNS